MASNDGAILRASGFAGGLARWRAGAGVVAGGQARAFVMPFFAFLGLVLIHSAPPTALREPAMTPFLG